MAMPKLERGRIDGVHGMGRFTAVELHEIADDLERQAKEPTSPDDPKWLLRRARKIRLLAEAKEKALEHKRAQ